MGCHCLLPKAAYITTTSFFGLLTKILWQRKEGKKEGSKKDEEGKKEGEGEGGKEKEFQQKYRLAIGV